MKAYLFAVVMVIAATMYTANAQGTCSDSVIDLAFVVDGSGSICDDTPSKVTNGGVTICDNWKEVRNFIVNITNGLNVGSSQARVAMATFSSKGKLMWDLSRFTDKASLTGAVASMEYPGGTTNTYEGIHVMRENIFQNSPGNRANVRDVAIILTDGKPTAAYPSPQPEAQLAQDENINMIAVGITTSVDANTLEYLSSSPRVLDKNYFISANFSELPKIVQAITEQACATQAPVPSPTPAPSTPAPALGCNGQADVVVILDSSGSIGAANFGIAKQFLGSLVDDLAIEGGRVRLGLLTFSNGADIRFHLNRYSDRQQIKNAIDAIPYTRGTTNTAAALDAVVDQMFTGGNGDRPGVLNVTVILTDGGSNDKSRTLASSRRVKKDTLLLVMGIGDWTDTYELAAIASDPSEVNYWAVPNYSALSSFQQRLKDALCNNNNECNSNPCQNGGRCIDSFEKYYCVCPHPWGGVNCQYNCRRPVDAVFVLDASGSIGKENFQKVVEFSKDIVRSLPVEEQGGRIAMMTFGDNPQVTFHLREYTQRMQILDGMSIPYISDGTTNTAGALQYLRENMFTSGNGDQTNVPNVAFVVTDGRSNDYARTWQQAIEARKNGIRLIAIGVGSNVRVKELRSIASYPTDKNVFVVNSFDALGDIIDNVRDITCDAVNECANNPCLNGGSCQDYLGGYACLCQRSYTGRNCERNCPGDIDLLFIVDKSGSVQHERFDDVKEMLVQVVEQLEVWSDRVRVAAISFHDIATLEFQLDKYTGIGAKQDIQEAIRNMVFGGGRTNIASALEMGRQQIFLSSTGDRSAADNIVLVFTDAGANIRSSDTIPQAILDKISGMHIVSIGVGRDLNMMELRGIASNPSNSNVHVIDTFTRLSDLIQPMVGGTCNDVNECLSSPCENSGTCVDEYMSYRCVCPDDRSGRNCERRCGSQYDILFIMDLSGSVSDVNDVFMPFMEEVVHGLEFRFDTTRAALITFSDQATTHFKLDTYSDKRDVLNAIALDKVGGRTNTQDSLRLAKEEIFTGTNGDRSGVQNVVVLATDGGSNINPLNTIPNANALKIGGTEVRVVALGPQVDMTEINGMASNPTEPYVFRLNGANEVNFVAGSLLDDLCQ